MQMYLKILRSVVLHFEIISGNLSVHLKKKNMVRCLNNFWSQIIQCMKNFWVKYVTVNFILLYPHLHK